MRLDLELRHLYSVVVLAEEMHFTRASHRLRIAQPSLSKQLQQIERSHGVRLFARDKGRIVELTDAGRTFVDEARLAIFHAERALNLARADCRADDSLVIGYSPDADHAWVSGILATRRPSYTNVRIRLSSRFAMDLVRGVLVGELNLALVTAPPEEIRITAVPFARRPLYAVSPDSHRYACRKGLVLGDLADDDWILNARQVHPTIHDAILETAKRGNHMTRFCAERRTVSRVCKWKVHPRVRLQACQNSIPTWRLQLDDDEGYSLWPAPTRSLRALWWRLLVVGVNQTQTIQHHRSPVQHPNQLCSGIPSRRSQVTRFGLPSADFSGDIGLKWHCDGAAPLRAQQESGRLVFGPRYRMP